MEAKKTTLYDWVNTPNHIILDGTDSDGERLLKHFLKDYVAQTNEHINATCPSCLNDYIKNYKNLFKMENTKECDYLLNSEFNGIPLKFNSPVLVTNENITNEYGKILKERFESLGTKPEIIFAKFPKEEAKESKLKDTPDKGKTDAPKDKAKEVVTPVVKTEVTPETTKAPVLTPEEMLKALNTEVKEPITVTEPIDNNKVIDLEA